LPLSIAFRNASVNSVAVNDFLFSPSRASDSVSVVRSVKVLFSFSAAAFHEFLLLALDPDGDGQGQQ
jgi:hypothetical protein